MGKLHRIQFKKNLVWMFSFYLNWNRIKENAVWEFIFDRAINR